MDLVAASEKVPEHFKYKWLTQPRESLKDGILDASQVVGLESSNLKPLESREREPSLGALSLPPEILRMIFTRLSFPDLKNVIAVNTLIRSHVVSIPEYQTVKAYAPALLTVLWKTNLIEHFPLCRIYSLLVSSQCTVCAHFGAYVFLPGLQRCCQRCAENNREFIPISQDTAKKQYGVRKSDMKLLPKLVSLEGLYRSPTGDLQRYKGKHMLVSRAEARRFGNEDSGNEDSVAHTDLNYQRNMALLPLPVLLPKEGSVDWGFCCKGCMVAYYNVQTDCNCAIHEAGRNGRYLGRLESRCRGSQQAVLVGLQA